MTPTRRLGKNGPELFPLALGCMGMTAMYGPADEAESLATIHTALDRGVNLLDTGDFYGLGQNELLIGKALKQAHTRPLLSVKFGALREPTGGWIGVDGRPQAVKNFLAHSLTRLDVDHVDVYRLARLDPQVPIEDTIGAVAEMVKAGYVRHIGLSEVGPETIRRAAAVSPIVDLQIEYSLVSRGPEAAIFPLLQELGIGVTAYAVLSRGLLSGSTPKGAADYRAYLPRFTGGNLEHNQALHERLAAIAREKGTTSAALAVAWVLAKSRSIVPLVGARTRAQLRDSLAAVDLVLTPEDLRRIEAAVPAEEVAGTRYDAQHMSHLDSERARV